MKIQPGFQPANTDRLSSTDAVSGPDQGVRSGHAPAPGGDAVRVSGDAHLAAEAATRIGDVGQDQIRPGVVEEAKAAMARGEIGADLDRLANRLIDGLLDE